MLEYKFVASILVAVVVAYLIRQQFFPPYVQSPVIEIASGKLQGRVSVSRDGREYFEYLGVPYAKPPIGQLRYEPPEPITETWDGVRDATEVGSVCIQVDTLLNSIQGSEDCLFVNIHTPKLDVDKTPVILWIHGGGFVFGSGNIYRPDYFMDEDVVLVTVNFRLASFGFLNTEDGIIRGNMGLKDQNMALRWVRKNIHKFGGNPNDVTLMGESSGAISVHHHMLSSMSKGLFHKAIAQSGLVSNPWSVYFTPGEQAKRFANQVNCSTGNTKEMVKCLKNRTALELVSVHLECKDMLHPLIATYFPTIEIEMHDGKSFLTQNPRTILESGKFHHVPFLSGVNSAEGLAVASSIVANRTVTQHVGNDWAKALGPLLMFPDNTDSATLEKIKTYYRLGDFELENPIRLLEKLSNFIGDWMWKVCFHNGMQIHAKFATDATPLFIYYYTYEGENSLDQIILSLKGDYHPIVEIVWMKVRNWIKVNLLGQVIPRYGACHGDELAMQFNMPPMSSVHQGSQDYEFSKNIVNLLVQFVKLDTTLKKQPMLEFMGEKWIPQKSNKSLRYFQLNLKPKMIEDPFQESVRFWDKIKLLQ